MCFGARSWLSPSGSIVPTITSGATVKNEGQIGESTDSETDRWSGTSCSSAMGRAYTHPGGIVHGQTLPAISSSY